jgi:D-alanyl-D-alanine dipeptidase
VRLDLRYNGVKNFMQEDLYQGFNRAFLHKLAYDKFMQACVFLEQQDKNLCFVVFDALRPRSVQIKMYEFLRGTPMQQYVADPTLGSLHNFGMALDLTLAISSSNSFELLDMGTEFDDFSELAQAQLESQLHSAGKLSLEQIHNRKCLREIMERAGFTQLPTEWWHFNAFPAEKVRQFYPIVE